MTNNRASLLKAAAIARINLTKDEQDKLVSEIDEVLQVFSRIDQFNEYVEEPRHSIKRKLRDDKSEKCRSSPFSNSNLIENKKFKGPKLVD